MHKPNQGVPPATGSGEQFLLQALSLSGGMVLELDVEGRIAFASPRFCRSAGYRDGDLTGCPYSHLKPGDAEGRPHHAWASVLAGEAWHGEALLRHRTGRFFWTEETLVARRSPDGAFEGVLALHRDAEQSKQLEAALRESRRYLEDLFEDSPLAVHELDRDGAYRRVNRAAGEMLGLDAAELLGLPVWNSIAPGDREAARHDYRERIAERLPLAPLFRRLVDGRGKVRTLEVYDHLMRDEAGVVNGMREIMVDRSERVQAEESLRRSEEEFRRVWEKSLDAMRLTSAQGIILRVNQAFCQLTGREREQLEGHPFTVAYDTADRERVLAAYVARVEQGRLEPVMEREIRLWDGRIRWVALSNTLIESASGPAVLSIVRDVSEQKLVEEELRSAKEKAEAAAKAKSAFLASMSHEVRTPMNGIIGMTGLLLDTPLSPEQRGYTESVKGSAEALLTIVNDVLDFSKIEAGRMSVDRVAFDLRGMIEDVAEILAPLAHAKGLEFHLDYDPAAPAEVEGDSGRVRQILLNLAGNAIKFTHRGFIQVSVRSGGKAECGEIIAISVRDSGVGIESAKIPLLFREFTQVDSSTTRHFGGTGLGLAISRRLVALMKGSLGVVSQPGAGSVFTAQIPFPLPPPTAQPETPALAGVRVLLVDSSPIGRGILRRQCEGWGMVAETADSTAEAWRRIQEEPGTFQVVVLDKHSPCEAGGRLVECIRKSRSLPAVVLTLGAAGKTCPAPPGSTCICLMKPVRARTLRHALGQALGLESGAAAPVAASSHREIATFPDARALLVEDNRVNQLVGGRFLEKLGFRVDVAANGIEALEMAGRLPYDVILMDCQMPEMDGFQATQAIRKLDSAVSGTPIIAMTAHAMEGDREHCLAAGMSDYIAKPVRLEALERVLVRWLQPSRA